MAGQRTLSELRPLREADIAALSWLPTVARDIGCDRWASEDDLLGAISASNVLAVVEHSPLGLLAYDTGTPHKNAARIRFLAVEPARRRLGVGSRAALALEVRLRSSTKDIYVTVPARLGLAFYFWLRLGYRPLTQKDWPARPEETPSVWMVRSLG